MRPKSWLKSVALTLGQRPLLKHFFGFLYKIQLKLIVAALRQQKEIGAIILRRKEVLEDLYPGDSDYDITCVAKVGDSNIETALLVWTKRHKYLKIICPVLGETKFIDARNFSAHLEYGFADYYGYYDNLYFLCRKRGFELARPRNYSSIAIYKRILQLLIHKALPEYLFSPGGNSPRKKTFSRSAYKINRKIKGLINFAHAGKPENFSYDYKTRSLGKQHFMLTCASKNKLLKESMDMIRNLQPISGQTQNINFTTVGNNELLPRNSINQIQIMLSPLTTEFSNLFDEIILSNYRLYKFQKILLLKCRKSVSWDDNQRLLTVLRKCAIVLRPYYSYLGVRCPIILDCQLWNFTMQVDPIAKILYQHEHYDFIDNKKVLSNRQSGQLAREALCADLAEAIGMIYSALRIGCTAYWLELLFGRLIVNNLLLETGKLYTSFTELRQNYLSKLNLNKEARDIMDIYQQGDCQKIEKTTILHAWRVFKNLAFQETNKAGIALEKTK